MDLGRWLSLRLIVTLGILLGLGACGTDLTPGPDSNGQPGFALRVDPLRQTVTPASVAFGGVGPQFLPSDSRILIPGTDLELDTYSYSFNPAKKLLSLRVRFKNVSSAEFIQPFFFTLKADLSAAFDHASAPLVGDEQLGGDGILSPGERTAKLDFEVVHRGEPFTFFIDVSAVSVTLNELGHLGGTWSWALDVNDSGQVVGTSWTGFDQNRAFLFEDGQMSNLGTLGGDYSEATGINDAGQVVGCSTTDVALGPNETCHAFLWEEGVMTDLGTLGGPMSRAEDINERGQVVGRSSTASGAIHAFLWQDGVMTDLGTLKGTESRAWAINNRGQVVGDSDGRAVLWDNGSVSDLGHGEAHDINESAQIVGMSDFEGALQAFLWEDGKLRFLGTLDAPYSIARGINDAGEIVGANWGGGKEDQAFYWANGSMTHLKGRADDLGSTAYKVSNRRQIVGDSHTLIPPNYVTPRAVLWNLGR